MTRPYLDALAERTEAEATTRGAMLARARLAQEACRRADLIEGLARRARAGDVEPVSALAEGLDQMAAGLRLLGCAEASELALPVTRPRGFWGRLRWLFTGR